MLSYFSSRISAKVGFYTLWVLTTIILYILAVLRLIFVNGSSKFFSDRFTSPRDTGFYRSEFEDYYTKEGFH